ncbi:Protein piccolo [Tupaia chinensis]|uniref:Protein piccolo n=1 Tax=Tupaia chinensis TaxID=246437 RepID=L9K4D1_TUPCH|nr:Protein piccolo [Tupaia chinensis]
MGNEASLEGEGLPEGLAGAAAAAAAAAGGEAGGAGSPLHTVIPAGMEADLSQLSEEERRQIAAVMSRAQGLPKGSVPPAAAESPSMHRHAQHAVYVQAYMYSFSCTYVPAHSEASQDETIKKQKVAQKEQGKPEGITKPPSQPQSPKPVHKHEGPVREPLERGGSPKSISSQQPEKIKSQPSGTGKPIQGPAQTPQTDQTKLPLQRDPSRPQTKQSDIVRGEPVKPSPQSPSKSSIQQASPGKTPAQQPGPEKPQTGPSKAPAQQPGLAKPLTQQPGTVKAPAQLPGTTKPPAQPLGTAKPSAQQAGSDKPSSQQPGPKSVAQPPGLGKTSAQQPGPGKSAAQQLGSPKPPAQPEPLSTSKTPGTTKAPAQQAGPTKSLAQQPGPGKTPAQQPGPGKPPAQQSGPTKMSSQQSSPAKPPLQQPSPAKPSAQQAAKPVSQIGTGKPLQPATSSPSAAQTPVQGLPKTICPLCNTTELLLHVPEKANFNTCTECQTTVCSLCGFNPNPHLTEIKEWLCLNCQMQRALGGDLAPVPSSPQPKPKTASAIPTSAVSKSSQQAQQSSPKKDTSLKQDLSKAPESKKPPPLVKQPTLHGSPTHTAKQPPVAESSPKPAPPKEPSVPSEQAKPPVADEKPKQPKTVKPPTDTVSSSSATKPDIPSPKVQSQVQDKTTPPLKTDSAKPSQSFPPTGEKVTPFDSKAIPRPASDSKIISQPEPSSESKVQKQVDPIQKKEEPKKAQSKMSPKPDAKPMPKGSPTPPGPRLTSGQTAPASQQPTKPQEQSRRFSLNLGSITDAPKSQPTTPQETVTGKLFGFGASIFSQASNLISTAGQPGPHSQSGPGASTKQAPLPSQPPASQGPPKSTGQGPSAAPAKVMPMKKETKAPVTEKLEPKVEQAPTVKRTEAEMKVPPVKDSKPLAAEPQKTDLPLKPEKTPKLELTCPLCKTELNIGSQDPPNFNTCTECKKQVCNLCGFNPTPHLTESAKGFLQALECSHTSA